STLRPAPRRDGSGAGVHAAPEAGAATVTLRLRHAAPYDGAAFVGHVAARAVPGLEEARLDAGRGGSVRRVVPARGGDALVDLTP
ncbi:AlkA N-terminal domain-containing protein, partial [Streptococcus pyogenes]|uniref:AlkA N-terminal domain-containing protein n=1 Tax=Streptococcus pyogenes TaxID=1314 RepID=UPI003DA1153D